MNLREATAELHSKAEKMEFHQRMFRGELNNSEYLSYLNQQYIIFSTIENIFPNSLHYDLIRTKKIQEDIMEIIQQEITPIVYLESTKKYSIYLYSLNYKDIIPHIYLNYLALVYGGQIMKTKVPGSGGMYDFENTQDAISAIRAVQKDEWADEVNKGFKFIIEIADELQSITGYNS